MQIKERSSQERLSQARKWRVKKDKLLTLVYFEDNLAFVPTSNLWVDSGATTHISISTQGCMWSQPPNDAERFIYVGDGNAVAIEAIGIFRLLLKSGCFFGFE